MNKLPKHFFCTLKDDFKNLDYSKWERSNRTKGPRWTQPVLWAPAPPGGQRTARPSHRPTSGVHNETPSPPDPKQAQSEKPGRFRESSTQESPPVSSRLSRRERWEDKSECMNDKAKILELLVGWRRGAVEELENHCRLLQDVNQRLAGDVEDTDRHSVSRARELLIQHAKLGSSAAAYDRWNSRQIGHARAELEETVMEIKEGLSGLEAKLETVTAEVLSARGELHTLKTYKDEEYPVKALQIANMKREMDQLQEAQQDEHDDVSALCQMEMANQEKQLQQKQQEMLSAMAKQSVSLVPPLIKHMALHNQTMKREIKLHTQEIMQLEDKNSALLRNIQALQLLKPSSSRGVFLDVFPKSDRCAPDIDVHLSITKDACLPI